MESRVVEKSHCFDGADTDHFATPETNATPADGMLSG